MSNKNKILKVAAFLMACSLTFVSQTALATSNLNQKLQDTKKDLENIESSINEQEAQIEQYEQEISSSNAQKAEVNSILADLESQRLSLEDQIYQLNGQIQNTLDKIYGLEVQIIEIESEIAAKEQEIEVLKARIADNTELLRERVRISYKMGDADKIEILFTSSDINDFLSRNKMITTIADYDKNLIDTLREDQARLDSLLLELNGNKMTLEISKENAEIEKANLEDQKSALNVLISQVKAEESEKYASLSNINASLAEYESALDEKLANKSELSQQKDSLNAEIASLEREIAEEQARIEAERKAEEARKAEETRKAEEARKAEERRKAEAERLAAIEAKKADLENRQEELKQVEQVSEKSASSTKLAWPAATYGITSYYGYRVAPLAGASTFHQGIDIGGPYGTAIYAAESGTVTTIGYNAFSGNYITLTHSNGLQTRYVHLQTVGVSRGQSVSRGDYIAGMGSTGNSTGPHLHFEVIVNGQKVNPLPYIR